MHFIAHYSGKKLLEHKKYAEQIFRKTLPVILWPMWIYSHRYVDFHQKQLGIVDTYPDMVTGELNNYDKAVCRFFTVDRRNPEVG